MNAVEYRNLFDNMSEEQRISELHRMENAVQGMSELSDNLTQLQNELDVKKGSYIANKVSIFLFGVMCVITGAVALWLCMKSEDSSFFSIMRYPALFGFVTFFC